MGEVPLQGGEGAARDPPPPRPLSSDVYGGAFLGGAFFISEVPLLISEVPLQGGAFLISEVPLQHKKNVRTKKLVRASLLSEGKSKPTLNLFSPCSVLGHLA